ncbi:MAG: tripartite tricarboxylate transporter substrate binding protein [Betaproteobacteria bacterium]|nr:tripartite tricarboxylate transporter substrate binding protein [Betaproteobacteria bacterium]
MSAAAWAQTFPAKPVRLIVGFAAGGGTDTLARVISKKLVERWPHALVVENRPGADGSIATELVAKAPPDGYTLVMVSNAFTITPFQRKLGYDPVKDLSPVTQVAYIPNLLLVHPSLPVKSVKQLIALARQRPGELSFGSSGTGTSPYLAMELFKSMTGINMVHVPYKGSNPAVIDLIGGHIQLMFGAISTTIAHVKAGKIRALAVSSPRRWPAVPELPTVAESGLPGFEAATWYGVLAPAATPPEIVARLHGDMAGALNAPDVKSYVAGLGFAPVANKPEEFGQIIRNDMAKWGKLLRAIQSKQR